ncbi:MAG TPA: hypothetical protein VM124_03775 [Candidatus Limnocylindrales bacterium]|nr:hypothetical protein [Candidatus Limnocylindrales bacterium]
MENESPSQPNLAQDTDIPSTQPNIITRAKVIQPLNDMSAYVNSNQSPTSSQPVSTEQQVNNNPDVPFDSSKIYAEATHNTTSAVQNAVTTNNETAKSNQRVAIRVPALQIYAFLIILFRLYGLIATMNFYRIAHTSQTSLGNVSSSDSIFNSPLLFIALGASLINISICVYLLVAKNIQTVKTLLTALLILNGIDLLYLIMIRVKYLSGSSFSSIISLLVSVGFLLYLWSIRSQVDVEDSRSRN